MKIVNDGLQKKIIEIIKNYNCHFCNQDCPLGRYETGCVISASKQIIQIINDGESI